jgi:DNA-binding transcriptional ArsR family regulator
MAQNKSEVFSPTDQQIAAWAKALAHPARVAILRVLAERGSCVCGSVVKVIPLAQATVSQHLKELKEAGLVTGEVDGPRMCYCIHTENMALAASQMSEFLESLKKPVSMDCC